jgi:hypothetical protein
LFALLLAKINSCALITGDDALRKAAKEEGVPVHGLLWILDRLVEYINQSIIEPTFFKRRTLFLLYERVREFYRGDVPYAA